MLQLTEQLQQLQDQQLARDLQRSLLEEASRQALDHRLAASIGDQRRRGPAALPSMPLANPWRHAPLATPYSSGWHLRQKWRAAIQGGRGVAQPSHHQQVHKLRAVVTGPAVAAKPHLSADVLITTLVSHPFAVQETSCGREVQY